jgi:hypothetical protein
MPINNFFFLGGVKMGKRKKTKISKGKNIKVIFPIVALLFIGGVFGGWVIFSQKEMELDSVIPGIDLNAYPVPPGGETRPTLSPALFFGRVAMAYRAAREIPQVLDKIYCYCDCELNFGHKSNLTCFVDRHGTKCDICVNQALDAYQMTQEGLPVEEIKKRIDSIYGKRLKSYSKAERASLISFMQDVLRENKGKGG